MDSVNMSSLLLAEEDKIRTELRADSAIDQNRRQSIDRLNNVLDGVLLRYNAANAPTGVAHPQEDGNATPAQP